MADLPSDDDLQRVARDEILANSTRLTVAVLDRQGTDANAYASAIREVGSTVVGQLARVEGVLFLDSAKGRDLDRLVFDRFGLLRKPAAPGLGSVNFSTTTPTTGAFTIPVGARLGTSDGKTYLVSVAAVFPFGSTGPIAVAVQSAKAGLSQQAKPHTITSLATTLTGSPTDLVVDNPLATAGASDEENDDDLRDRARAFWTTAVKGTLAAIEQDALTVPGVRRATAIEFLDGFGRPAKAVELVVADSFTDALVAVSPTPVAYAAQSQMLASAVFNGLSDTRAAGIYVLVRVAQVVLQGVTLALAFQAGIDVDLTAFRARVAIVNLVNALNPGETLTVAAMIAALRTVPGLIVTGDEILSPVGDVVPLPLQALRTTLSLVRASSLQPDQALQGSTNVDGASA